MIRNWKWKRNKEKRKIENGNISTYISIMFINGMLIVMYSLFTSISSLNLPPNPMWLFDDYDHFTSDQASIQKREATFPGSHM